MTQEAPTSMITVIEDVRKADTKALITNGAEAFPEDSFEGVYWTGGGVTGTAPIIEPTYKPGTLQAITTQNNTLAQCVEAMEVNIDGTGHSIELMSEDESPDEAEKQMLEDFFNEPFPGVSMIAIRRPLRRDREETGSSYMEVIRSANNDIVMINHLPAVDMRLVRLDDPVPVPKTIVRKGKEITVQVRTRERRFVQLVNGKKVFFREFGSSREIDRETGKWAEKGRSLPVDKRGSEIVYFSGPKEAKSPYGTTRWINQLPSVLGSRKAEEFNLEFFDGGGIPPVLVLIEGGTLGDEVRRELRNHLSGKTSKHRAAIVEATSTSGSLDSSGQVRVRVERFGAERQQDAMFQTYDEKAAEHVRMSFRLPQMFLGKSEDYSFATALTAYMVAEAQVFYPERDAFDSVINHTIVKALGAKKYVFRSLPLTLVNVENQLKALEMVIPEKMVSGEEIVSKLNEITGLSMEYDEEGAKKAEEEKKAQAEALAKSNQQPGQEAPQPGQEPPTKPGGAPAKGKDGKPLPQPPTAPKDSTKPEGEVKKFDVSSEGPIVKLAGEWAQAFGLEGEEVQSLYSATAKQKIMKAVASLGDGDSTVFSQVLASRSINYLSNDQDGLSALCGCAAHLEMDEHD